jgi:hypothetical protein
MIEAKENTDWTVYKKMCKFYIVSTELDFLLLFLIFLHIQKFVFSEGFPLKPSKYVIKWAHISFII